MNFSAANDVQIAIADAYLLEESSQACSSS